MTMTAVKHTALTNAQDMNEDVLVSVPLDALIPYANNPRVNDHAVGQMADIIANHGFRVPVLVRTNADDPDKFDLVDGHLRLKAARRLGMESLPAVVVDDMTDEQVRAFRVSVNRAAELADWDMSKLADEFQALKAMFSDDLPKMTGFDETALKALARDTTPPPAAPPVTREEPVSRSADRKKATHDTDTVELTFTMTAADRQEAMDAIEKLRAARGLASNAATIMAVLREATSMDAAAKPRRRTRA